VGTTTFFESFAYRAKKITASRIQIESTVRADMIKELLLVLGTPV